MERLPDWRKHVVEEVDSIYLTALMETVLNIYNQTNNPYWLQEYEDLRAELALQIKYEEGWNGEVAI